MRFVLIFTFIFFSQCCSAQLFEHNFDKIVCNNKRAARRILTRCLTVDFDKARFTSIRARQFEYLTIATFQIAEPAVNYDSSQQISNYLKLYREEPLSHFYVLVADEYEGVMDLSGKVDFNFKRKTDYCTYDDSKEFLKDDYNTMMFNALNILRRYEFSFLFTVKCIRNCIWFVENEKVFVLNMENMKVYEPDEFINENDLTEKIREVALNPEIRFCY